MHFCFLFRSLETGGIQTLMLRMTTWLQRHGHSITILTAEGGTLASAFPSHTRLIIDTPWYDAILQGTAQVSHTFLRSHSSLPYIDVFFACSQEALWVAASLLNAQRRPAKCLAGIYGPHDYGAGFLARVRGLVPFAYPEFYLFVKQLPAPCRLFMNDAIRRSLRTYNSDSAHGIIWPLPVDAHPFRQIVRAPTHGRIVSVGRLVHMKDYNLWMLDVIAQLLARGHNVTWDIYGDGPLRPIMEQRVKQLGLDQRVFLKGELSYSTFPSALSTAWAFVGMGTSLVEAACAGVPAIVAEGFDTTPTTYGYLNDLPEYAVGEPLSYPKRPIVNVLEELLSMPTPEYTELSRRQCQHAERFDLEHLMDRFLAIVAQAPLISRLWRPRLATLTRSLRSAWRRASAATRQARTLVTQPRI